MIELDIPHPTKATNRSVEHDGEAQPTEREALNDDRSGYSVTEDAFGSSQLIPGGQTRLAISWVIQGDRATVLLDGEVDLATSPRLVDALRTLVLAGAQNIVLDLAGVPFLDSAGLRALLEVHHLGASLVLRDPTERVRRVLKMVLIDPEIPIAGDPTRGPTSAAPDQ